MRASATRWALTLILVAAACGGGGAPDAGDAAAGDDARVDAGSVPLDAAVDAGAHDARGPSDGGDAGDTGDAGVDAGPPRDLPWFEDVTERAGLAFERVAADGWASLPDRMGGGVCVLDADGEGPLDLFFAMRPAGGSRLFAASVPLAYVDQTEPLGLGGVGDALGCLAFDADGDGDDDLLVTGLGTLELWLRDEATFVRSDVLPPVDPRDLMTSAAAADFDGDGDLDLVVAGFVRLDEAFAPDPADCIADGCAGSIGSWPPVDNLLLVRDDAGRYRDAAATLAPELRIGEPTLVVTAPDIDDDGRADIFVGNDLGRVGYPDHPLLRGADGVFRDPLTLGLDRKASGLSTCTMGVAHGDLDGNGRLDTVTTSFEYDPSGVFLCFPEAPCEERGEAWGVGDAENSFRWGVAMGDFDADGWLDVIESTGNLLSEDELSRVGSSGRWAQPANLFVNRAGERLELVVPAATDGLSVARRTRGLAVVDLDDDGALDVVLAPNQGPPGVLRNVRAPAGHWLRVVLEGAPPNPGAVGAQVTVETVDGVWRRQRRVGEGFLGNFDPRLHFGLPTGAPARVTVRWPDGSTTAVDSPAVDRELRIRR